MSEMLVNAAWVANHLGVTRQTISFMLADGRMPPAAATINGKTPLWRPADFEGWVKKPNGHVHIPPRAPDISEHVVRALAHHLCDRKTDWSQHVRQDGEPCAVCMSMARHTQGLVADRLPPSDAGTRRSRGSVGAVDGRHPR